MEQIEIILDAEGIEKDLEQLTRKCQLEMDYDRESNFDGALCCSVIGAVANIAMFLLQAYSMWGNRRISFRTKDIEVDEITIKKVLEYLESHQDINQDGTNQSE